MARKAGFCRECNKNVYLKKDGSCPFGHPVSSIEAPKTSTQLALVTRMGFCKECGKPVLLAKSGTCYAKHPKSSITATEEYKVPKRQIVYRNTFFVFVILIVVRASAAITGTPSHPLTEDLLNLGVLVFGLLWLNESMVTRRRVKRAVLQKHEQRKK